MIDEYCRKEFEKALDIIGKQAHQLSVLKNCLEKLKTARDWQSVEEVDAYIDTLLAACEK